MNQPPKTTEAQGLAGIAQHEWELFHEHFTAYLVLFLVKVGLFILILKIHKTAGIKGEVIPAIVLAAVGIGMTILFHRSTTSNPASSQQSK